VPTQTTTASISAGACAPERLEPASKPHFSRPLRLDWLSVGVLIAINLLCFYRTLTGYFAADDFIHVTYLEKVCNGRPDLLLANFVSNWMQTHGTQFYRPLVSISMAFDYCIGGGNATTFHITNTCLQIASAIFLYLLAKRLLKDGGERHSQLAAFACAALFSAYPLHAEVVSWVIGRVDSLCTTFYLAAFWLFLKGQQERSRLAMAGSFTCFLLSLMSKEMAITLPATLALCCLFEGNKRSLFERASHALRNTWPFWAALGGYFVVRVIALGTIFGGYSGAIGESLGNSFIKRWFQDGSLRRILFPLNAEIFQEGDKTAKHLLYVYGAAGLLLAVRALVFQVQCGLSKYFFFALIWFVVAMTPAYQVWNLTENLQGSRFIYLGSAPLCLALALVLIPLFDSESRWRKVFTFAGTICALALLLLFAKVAYKDNLAWSHAFTHIRDFKEAVEQRVSELPADRKLVLLNVPQKQEGAHMVYNASMLGILLAPPLTRPDISHRVISFEPMTYGFEDLVTPSRLRALGEKRAAYDFAAWNRSSHKLEPLQISHQATSPFIVDVTSLNSALTADSSFGKTAQLVSPRLNLPAMSYDTVQVRMRIMPQGKTKVPPAIYLFWNTREQLSFQPARMLSLPAVADGQVHEYVFHVSEHKSWLSANTIESIQIELPFFAGQKQVVAGRPQVGVESVSLEPLCAPQLVPASHNLRTDGDGVVRNLSWPIAFRAASNRDCTGVLVEVSRESAWFEHYTGTYRDDKPSASALKTFSLRPAEGKNFTLAASDFPCGGYYQVRAFSVDKKGTTQGFASDPINLQLTK
jgi:hypothetical protein